jgi:hypothetical protein
MVTLRENVGNYIQRDPKNHKKEGNKKNLIAKDSSNQVESSSDMDDKIV